MRSTAILTTILGTSSALALPSWFGFGGSHPANPEGHGVPKPNSGNHFPIAGGSNSTAPYPTGSAAPTFSVPSVQPTAVPTSAPTAVPSAVPSAAPAGHGPPAGHGQQGGQSQAGHGGPPAGHGPPGGMHGHAGQDGGQPSYGSQGPPHGIQGKPFHCPPMEKRDPVIKPYQ